jgi:hypothetical protein
VPYRKISIELVMDEGNADAWMKTMRGAIGEMDKHASLKRMPSSRIILSRLPGSFYES